MFQKNVWHKIDVIFYNIIFVNKNNVNKTIIRIKNILFDHINFVLFGNVFINVLPYFSFWDYHNHIKTRLTYVGTYRLMI